MIRLTPRPSARPRTLTELLDPREQSGLFVLFSVAAVVALGALRGSGLLVTWQAAIVALAVGSIPWLLKWSAELKTWGLPVVLLAALVVAQGLHTGEHVLQLVQLYVLDWPAGRALGLVTAANLEWIHLAWNLVVLAGILVLLARGAGRSPWTWILLAWSLLHTGEHAYLLVRSLVVVSEASALGLETLPVTQALPGILGRDGVLATQSWCGRIPGLTTAPRAVIHFGWNLGEMVLLLAAGQAYLQRFSPTTSSVPPQRANAST